MKFNNNIRGLDVYKLHSLKTTKQTRKTTITSLFHFYDIKPEKEEGIFINFKRGGKQERVQ